MANLTLDQAEGIIITIDGVGRSVNTRIKWSNLI